VSFPHLSKAIPDIAMYLADVPVEVLSIFREVMSSGLEKSYYLLLINSNS